MDLAEALSPQQSGSRLAEIDQLNNLAKGVGIANDLNELSLAPAKARLANAHARLYEAQAQGAEDELNSTRAFAAQPPVEGETPLARLQRYAATQPPAKALKLYEGISKVLENTAQEEAARALSARRQTGRQIELLQRAAGLAGSATDQASWDRANDEFEALFGEPSPFKGMPFDPRHAQTVARGLLATKDQLLLQGQEADRALREKTQATRDRVATARVGALTAAETLARERTNILRRNGGAANPEVAESRRAAQELARARTEQINLRLRGTAPTNPITSLPAEAERLPGRWYQSGTRVGRWHPTTRKFYGPNETFPPLPATTGVAGKVQSVTGGLSWLQDLLSTDASRELNANLDPTDEGDD